MPCYAYECDACGNKEDITQSIKDVPVAACPKCNSLRFARVIGKTSFVLHGGGWAAQGYASTKKEKP